jgi:hypothetical protein
MNSEVLSLDDAERSDGSDDVIRILPLDSSEALLMSRQQCRYSKLLVAALQGDKEATQVPIQLKSDSLSRVISLVKAIDEALSRPWLSSENGSIDSHPNPFSEEEKEDQGITKAERIESKRLYAASVAISIRQHLTILDDNVASLRDLLAAANYLDMPLLQAIALRHYQLCIRHNIFSIAFIPKCAPHLLDALGIEYVGQAPPPIQVTSFFTLTRMTSGGAAGHEVLLDMTRQLDIRQSRMQHKFNVAAQRRDIGIDDAMARWRGLENEYASYQSECTASSLHPRTTQSLSLEKSLVKKWDKHMAQVRALAEQQWQVWKDDVLPIFQVPCIQVWQDAVAEAFRKIKLLDETITQTPEDSKCLNMLTPSYVTRILQDYIRRDEDVRSSNNENHHAMYNCCIRWIQCEAPTYLDTKKQSAHMEQMLLILLRRTCPLLREYWVSLVDDLKRHSDEAMDHISILTRMFGHALLAGYSFTGVYHAAMDPVDDRDVIVALLFVLEQYGLEQMRTTAPVSSFQFACSKWQGYVYEPYRHIMWSHFRTELATALHIPFNLLEAFSKVSTMVEFVGEHCPCVTTIEPVHVLDDSESVAAANAAAASLPSKATMTITTGSVDKIKWGTREQFYAELGSLYARKQAGNLFAQDVLRYTSSAKARSLPWIIPEVNVVSIHRVPTPSSQNVTLLQHMHKADTLFQYLDVYHRLSRGGWWYFVENDVREALWRMNNQHWTDGLAGIHPQPPQRDDDDDDRIKEMAAAADTNKTPIAFDQRTEQQIIADRQAANALKEAARVEEKKRLAMMKRRQEAAAAKKTASKSKSK